MILKVLNAFDLKSQGRIVADCVPQTSEADAADGAL